MLTRVRIFSGSDPDCLDKKISEFLEKFPKFKILFVAQSESSSSFSSGAGVTTRNQTVWHGTISIFYRIGDE